MLRGQVEQAQNVCQAAPEAVEPGHDDQVHLVVLDGLHEGVQADPTGRGCPRSPRPRARRRGSKPRSRAARRIASTWMSVCWSSVETRQYAATRGTFGVGIGVDLRLDYAVGQNPWTRPAGGRARSCRTARQRSPTGLVGREISSAPPRDHPEPPSSSTSSCRERGHGWPRHPSSYSKVPFRSPASR